MAKLARKDPSKFMSTLKDYQKRENSDKFQRRGILCELKNLPRARI